MNTLELIDYARQIDSANAELQALAAEYGEAGLCKPAAGGGWSAAECIDHVGVTLAAYLPGLRAAVAETRKGKRAEGPFSYGLLAKLMIWAIAPPVRLRTRAPETFAPRPQPDVKTAMETWFSHHSALQKLMEEADGWDLAAVKMASPANAKIKLPVGAVFAVLTAHARRHLLQAQRAVSGSGT
ncbi:MAG TPA: DinB family protein [Bryobacteraceae bacterium]|nr:DinB family protein [Bryobacteraceae bacterium]